LKKVEQELNRLGIVDIWRRGSENNNNAWTEVSKRYVDSECQKMKANMRDKRLLALYSELKNSWEREITQKCAHLRKEEV
jgi:hypothetical protein